MAHIGKDYPLYNPGRLFAADAPWGTWLATEMNVHVNIWSGSGHPYPSLTMPNCQPMYIGGSNPRIQYRQPLMLWPGHPLSFIGFDVFLGGLGYPFFQAYLHVGAANQFAVNVPIQWSNGNQNLIVFTTPEITRRSAEQYSIRLVAFRSRLTNGMIRPDRRPTPRRSDPGMPKESSYRHRPAVLKGKCGFAGLKCKAAAREPLAAAGGRPRSREDRKDPLLTARGRVS